MYKQTDFFRRGKKKSPIWKLRVKWNYNNNFDNLYNLLYKTSLTNFYEKKLYLKRYQKLENANSFYNERILNKYSEIMFDNSLGSIYSPQSKKFGLIYSDFILNSDYSLKYNKKITNNIYLFKDRRIFSYFYKTSTFSKVNTYHKNVMSINSNFVKKNISKNSRSDKFLKNSNLKIDINTLPKKRYNKFKFNNILKIDNDNMLIDLKDNSLKYLWQPKKISYFDDINYFDFKKKKF